ncbi:hypothetical protein LOTGIDRAFT_234736 [Lottia gigantea]|uniref:Bcl-2 Bcl-2 homology region 1-3 domain-containing protein n=1 Tax=Lottia gigantea TaxID=225164 RepID=V3ZZU7_LOTGI|nr:hypothetical protein LOTGIDRAFT_234736 [Lottia gigantea]ESO88195.1 hypothetical protein LOTGIDRAFT_234736 [Lottia gigantea]
MSTTGMDSNLYASKVSNMIVNKSLFAELSKQYRSLPGAAGLNDIGNVDECTQTPGSSSPLEQVRRDAEVIANDVVLTFGADETKKATNKYCKTMRRTVKEISERHDISFKGMVNKLKVEESGRTFETFVNVADEIFDDGQINWGRIVAVYAFAARLANYCRQKDLNDCPEKVSLYAGKYVGSKLGKWILDHGGWDAFVEFFPDHGEFEEKVWKGLLFTAVGLGALATVVASR